MRQSQTGYNSKKNIKTMAQVNHYETKAAYTADASRLKTKSAVSYIAENNEVIFDGVNTVVDKQSAAEGDLAVWDSVEGRVRFIKAATIVKAQIPATLKPFAVVLGWRGERALLASLSNASWSVWNIGRATAATNSRWAHALEVRVSGISATSAGTLAITLKSGASSDTVTATWSAGTTATIADAISAAIKTATTTANQNWTAAADGSDIIISHNASSVSIIEKISGTGGASSARISAQDDTDFQTTYGYITTTEYIRRRNGTNSNFAGCNLAKFYQYYSVNGTAGTNVGLHSTTILRESSFNEAENPIVYKAYNGDYKAYLYGEHLAQYPSAYGTMLRDGKDTTAWLAAQLGTAVRGAAEPRYPAAWLAANYDGGVEGFRVGAWWLPSVDEMMLMMQKRRYNAAETSTEDPVNDTLVKMGGATMYGNGYYPWTCGEYSNLSAFIFTGRNGRVYYGGKLTATSVRPVSAF